MFIHTVQLFKYSLSSHCRICTQQPVYVQQNYTFVVDLNALEDPDIKSDDCGHWVHNGRKSTKVAVWLKGNKVVSVKSTSKMTAPDETSKVFTLSRTYHYHDPHGDFKRTFFYLFGKHPMLVNIYKVPCASV